MIRKFIPSDFKIISWKNIEPYFINLKEREIASAKNLEQWLLDKSELESILEEDLAWRYIKMNCDTLDKNLSDSFNFFITEIEPEILKYDDIFNKNFYDSSFLKKLDSKKYYLIIRSVRKKIEMFREKNIPIIAKLQKEEQEYGKISSEMTINYDGKEHTLQQAANYLKNTKREIRKKVYHLINQRRIKDSEKLDNLFSNLLKKRCEIAKNADYENFRDYKFDDLGRFDYSIDDCYEFHKSIKDEVCPLINIINENRKKSLKLNSLKPWDLEVDVNLLPALKPFDNSNELIEKTIKCFSLIKPKYGEYLKIMKNKGFLDLDSRKGKAPGGFNYPLYESDIPFIFMNATGNLRDMETIMHEGGHAIHSFLSKDLGLVDFKELPSEVAELASMTMELISMDHWNIFFENEKELNRAKRKQLEGVLQVLPWVATIDKFQHWIYTNPEHSVKERKENWINIAREFGSKIIDWSENEDFFANSWQKQLHIFEIPFYYIEYGIAQLGAIAIWRNYKNNPDKALKNYENALELGYSVSIPEIYKTAGIEFNFSRKYIAQLMEFVLQELSELYKK
ncbi:MAG: M3 family oligoendopeptidase [Bacteroidales bacterium]|nr:M3 family oligoendopeptidase [Bacteroidales bacterium]